MGENRLIVSAFKLMYVFLLIVCLLTGQAGIAVVAAAANPETDAGVETGLLSTLPALQAVPSSDDVVYDFRLGAGADMTSATLEVNGWKYDGKTSGSAQYPTPDPVIDETGLFFPALRNPNPVNPLQELSFTIDVPATGLYRLGYTPGKYIAEGGSARIYIDNKLLGAVITRTYGTDAPAEQLLGNGFIELTAGTHTLKVSAYGAYAANTTRYVYVETFFLRSIDPHAGQLAFEEFNIKADKTSLDLQTDNTANVTLTDNAGTVGPLFGKDRINTVLARYASNSGLLPSLAITYTSSNPAVATAAQSGINATVTAIGPGAATITATAAYQGTVIASSSVDMLVTAGALNAIAVSVTEDTIILDSGQNPLLSVRGHTENGEMDIPLGSVSIMHSTPGVVQIDTATGEITALKTGVTTLTVSYGGYEEQVTITVMEADGLLRYNFKPANQGGVDLANATLEANGWRVGEVSPTILSRPNAFRNQSYGIGIFAEQNEYAELELLVPAAGLYTVHFKGYNANGGQQAALLIDGQELGQYYFGGTTELPEQTYKTLYLEQGVHTFRLVMIADLGARYMMPTYLKLAPAAAAPAFAATAGVELSPASVKLDETSRFIAKVKLSDNLIYTYDQFKSLPGNESATISYESLNTAIAAIDAATGLITPVSGGSATLKAYLTTGGQTYTYSAAITVKESVLARVVFDKTTNLMVVGDAPFALSAKAYADDNSEIMPSDALQISYSVSGDALALNADSGIVTAQQAGHATVAVTAVYRNGTPKTSSFDVEVAAASDAILYNFKPSAQGGVDLASATLEQNGWRIGEVSPTILSRGNAFRNQPYGIYIVASKGEYVTLDIRVPADGLYRVAFEGYQGNGGQQAALLIDGMEVGRRHFGQDMTEQRYRTVYLTAGDHSFRLVMMDDVTERLMMPTHLKLISTSSVPSFAESAGAALSQDNISLDETSRFIAKVKLSDGFVYEYEQFKAYPDYTGTISYESENTDVAVIDAATGLITPVRGGSATLKANLTLGGATYGYSAVVTVRERVLDHIVFDRTPDFLAVGDAPFALSVTAYAQDGGVIDAPQALTVAYSVTGNALTLDAAGKAVAAAQAGRATITANASYRGMEASASFEVEAGSALLYNFRPANQGGVDVANASLETNGWRVAEVSQEILDRSGGFRNQSYGLYILASKGEYAEFDIRVPAAGLYKVAFTGYKSGGGSQAALMIDGMEAGQHHFGALDQEQRYKTVYLAAGEHKFRLTMTANVAERLMMPSQLRLLATTTEPTFVASAGAAVSQNNVPVGRSVRLIAKANFSDGFAYAYDQFIAFPAMSGSTISYQSLNESLATIDGNGLITPQAAGTVQLKATLQSGGKEYAYQTGLTVTNQTLEQVSFQKTKNVLVVGGAPFVMSIVAYDNNGAVIKDPEGLQIVYKVSDDQVLAVENQNTLVAKAAGNATVTAEVTWGNGTKTASFPIEVWDQLQPAVMYDFRPPANGGTALLKEATLANSNWRLAELAPALAERSLAFRNQAYGIYMAANAGEYAEFDILVPSTDTYVVVYKSGSYNGGKLGEAAIDGKSVFVHNHGGTLGTNAPEQLYKSIYLTEGVHKLRLESLQSDGFLTPTWIKLVPAPAPTFVSAEGSVTKTDVIPGQTARFATTALLSDGFEYADNHFPDLLTASLSYASSDSAIAEIDGNGRITARTPGEATMSAILSLNGEEQPDPIQAAFKVGSKTFGSVSFDATKDTMSAGGPPFALSVKAYDNSGAGIDAQEDLQIVYSVTNNGVLALNTEMRTVTPVAVGEATVTATVTLGGVTHNASFTVQVVPEFLESISLEVNSKNIHIGDTPRINVVGHFSTGNKRYIGAPGDGYTISYGSSNPAVIGLASGMPAAIAAGDADVKVTVHDTATGETFEDNVPFKVRAVASSKTRRSYYTEEKIAAARVNMQSYDWASVQAQARIDAADSFLAQYSLEELWAMVTPQSIPRSASSDPGQSLGSPITGYELYQQYGNYPWKTDPAHPWKLIDPTTGAMFPTNDFAGFYELGLNDFGIFDPELARQRNDALVAEGEPGYLVNLSEYHTDDPSWGVDDGYGWHDGSNLYTFVAYYAHWHGGWHTTGGFLQALAAFGDAYMYTGDDKYGTAGIILLDRIADVYPELSTREFRKMGFMNSDNGTDRGKGVGSIWEANSIKIPLGAYDQLWPAAANADAIDFLSGKADRYHLGVLKQSATGIRMNIEENLVKEVFTAYKQADLRGNVGMHHSALALAAVVYDTLPETKEWLDYNFQAGNGGGSYDNTGGNLYATLVDVLNRDGHGDEAAPHYNSLWLGGYQLVADVLDGYDLYPGADLYDNVKFKKMFTANVGLTLSEKFIPAIGDTGSTGAPLSLLNFKQSVKAFEKYGDPIYAQIAYMLNGNSTRGIHSDIFTGNPEQVAADIGDVIDTHGLFNISSDNLTGYGLAALREGRNEMPAASIGHSFLGLEVLDTNSTTSAWPDSGTLQLENTIGAGKYIEFGFTVNEAGEYDVTLKPFGNTDIYGIYQIYINGVPVLEHDFKQPGAANAMSIPLGRFLLQEGQNSIKFVCTGTSSSNYKLGIIRLELLDAATADEQSSGAYSNTLRDLWMYYGRTGGHGHGDTLNIGIHGFGADLSPELGYPETADLAPHNTQWMKNTISHNTVVVNRKRVTDIIVADPLHFEDGGLVKLIDVRSPDSYSDTSEYRRTTAMIKVDEENSYYVDFFRVIGGSEHLFSFHGAEGEATVDGVALTPQNGGTYAGESIPWGSTDPSGFAWLENVERATAPGAGFSVDWDIVDTWNSFNNPSDDVHLRLTMLTELDELALADGIPPRNRPGNPESLRYMLAKRTGSDLDSNFVSVIEPYAGQRHVQSIEEVSLTRDGLPVATNDAKAVKVVLSNGRTDYIVYSADKDATYLVDNKFEFKGFFGVYTEEQGQQSGGYLSDASFIGNFTNPYTDALTAQITDFTRDLQVDNTITVALDLQGIAPEELIGRFIYIDNGNTRYNGSYRIRGIHSADNGGVTLEIGDITLVDGYQDPFDPALGYKYAIAAGQSALIPLSAEIRYEVDGAAASTAVPGKPTLTDNNGHDTGLRDGDYTIAMNLWWGSNGSVYRLYENDVLIETKLLSDRTPEAQSASTAISGRANGVYLYRAELANGYGTTASDPLVVTVTDAAPGVPVLSHDNWDGDGDFNMTMNMWWGTNGTTYRLYENDVLIDEQPLTATTPRAQTTATAISGRPPGTYEYRADLVNAAGVASSALIIVVVHSS
ncbi:heparinase II/III family protein [Paenibacillus sp. J5C_2022]|uniref:heparinase II/III domain-containing protein n=1 Tax=Paenibacillus sp. J5C2022 TaxID=2977129 RepID=UPI0021CE9177|nr:heparinase II/III family protein [Paenibacillus sp. J5C2022]MCU6707784.1 heparinase II/III family protein [Paenibacillus sp. J5C2022]